MKKKELQRVEIEYLSAKKRLKAAMLESWPPGTRITFFSQQNQVLPSNGDVVTARVTSRAMLVVRRVGGKRSVIGVPIENVLTATVTERCVLCGAPAAGYTTDTLGHVRGYCTRHFEELKDGAI